MKTRQLHNHISEFPRHLPRQFSRHTSLIKLFVILLLLFVAVQVIAQEGFTSDDILNPAEDSWPTYHGSYDGQRHSPLTQITPDNVHMMTMIWAFSGDSSFKGSPILYDDILYVTSVNRIWAVDPRNGREIWRYRYMDNDGFTIGQRGTAVSGNLVYLTTPDSHLVALDRFTGEVEWDIEIADYTRGYWSTNAPLLIRDNLIVGVSGDFDNLPGMLQSFHPQTGEHQWTFYSTLPSHLRDENSDKAMGGQMWMTGTYDPELNLLYVGTGNPTPVLNGVYRPGDNKWTNSIVALNPDTGEMAWGFQVSPHDTHDWDAAEVPVLFEAEFDGRMRKLVMQASRNGFFVVLDRETGENLLTTTFAATNWHNGVDDNGSPIPNLDKDPQRAGSLIAPDEGGATNYRSPAYDPESGLLIVSAADAYGIYFYKEEHGDYGWAGADYTIVSEGEIRAIDYRTGEIAWRHDLHGGAGSAGIMTTASGLTFTGDSVNNSLALRSSTGETLWHAGTGRIGNPPVTYMLDGRQYVLMAAGSTMYAWALPEKMTD